MRLWISPELEKIEIEDGGSHSTTIVDDPLRYGLDPVAVADYMREINDEDADAQFDFETVISLAEMAGWVRTSRDGARQDGEIAISACDVRRARKAIRSLIEDGHHFPGGIKLHIERIEGSLIVSEYRDLDGEALDLFLHNGRLPMARRDVTSVEPESIPLIKAVLDARKIWCGSSAPSLNTHRRTTS
jgi:hypothetical protein